LTDGIHSFVCLTGEEKKTAVSKAAAEKTLQKEQKDVSESKVAESADKAKQGTAYYLCSVTLFIVFLLVCLLTRLLGKLWTNFYETCRRLCMAQRHIS